MDAKTPMCLWLGLYKFNSRDSKIHMSLWCPAGVGKCVWTFSGGPQILRFFGSPFAWKSQFQLLKDSA